MSTDTTELNKAVVAFVSAVRDLLKKSAASSTASLDADALEHLTSDEIISKVMAVLTEHANNTNNPHDVDLNDISAYSKEELLEKASGGLPAGVLMVDHYGPANTDIPIGNITSENLTFTLPSQPVVLGGYNYTAPQQTFDCSAYTNCDKLRVYLTLKKGRLQYLLSKDYLPETPLRMAIGYVVTDSYHVTATSFKSVTRYGRYRGSFTCVGSALPMAYTTPDANGNYYFDDSWYGA